MAQELSLPGAIHLAAVAPAVAIGVAQLLMKKGTRLPQREVVRSERAPTMGWVRVAMSSPAAVVKPRAVFLWSGASSVTL